MWLPPFKYIKGLFASTEDDGISNASDGSTYIGPYFKVASGDVYSGEIPSKDSTLLIDNFSKKANKEKLGIKGINYDDLAEQDIDNIINHPKPRDYEKGFFTRYFVRDKRTKKIAEVTLDLFELYQKRIYIKGVELKWILEKPVKDIFNQGYLYKGAATRNRENVLVASRTIEGLSTFIADYSQYVDIESDVEGVPFEDLSNKDKIRLISKVDPINVQPSVKPIKTQFGETNNKYTKVRTNLYTNGGRYRIAGTKTQYVGFYHIHPEKGAMVGATHSLETHSKLIPLSIFTDSTVQETETFTPTFVPQQGGGTTYQDIEPTDGGGGSFSGGGGGYSGGGGSSGGDGGGGSSY